MTTHHIIGSTVGQDLGPAHGGMREYRRPRWSPLDKRLSLVVALIGGMILGGCFVAGQRVDGATHQTEAR